MNSTDHQYKYYSTHSIVSTDIIKMLTLSSCTDSHVFMQASENYLHDTVNTQDSWLEKERWS